MFLATLDNYLSTVDWTDIGHATLDTLSMTGWSLLFTVILGLPLGIFLFLTGRGQLLDNRPLYSVLALLANVIRSVPFIILLIIMIPFTVLVVGTSIGVLGAIPPLVIGATPFFARLVENVLREIDRGIIEACQAMGAKTHQIILHALLPEALPGLVAATTVTAIALVAYVAMAGVVGAGGLGDLAIRYGYQRFETGIMLITVAILIILVQILQVIGDTVVQRLTRK